MRIYLIHGKQRLEWLWVFQPRFLSWNAGITADLNPPRIFDPPVQIRYLSSVVPLWRGPK